MCDFKTNTNDIREVKPKGGCEILQTVGLMMNLAVQNGALGRDERKTMMHEVAAIRANSRSSGISL